MEARSPQPIFRNPSLTSETEASIEVDIVSSVGPSASSDSLASYPQGVTFAARARAAELQAARSRNELKSRDINLKAQHETMTFKPKSARKKWNTLDLSTLPEPEDDSPTRGSENTQTLDDEATPRAESIPLPADNNQQEQERMAAEAGSSLMQPTFADMLRAEPEPLSSHPERSSNVNPHHAVGDQPISAEKKIFEGAPSFQSPGLGKENIALPRVRHAPGFSLEPVPILTKPGDSEWNREHTEQLLKQQEQQIATLTARLRQQSLEAQKPLPTSQVGLSRQLPPASGSDQASHRVDGGLRQIPHRQYPAVKGTMENTVRPTMMGIRPPPGFGSKAVSIRKASGEGKVFFLCHVNLIAENDASGRSNLTGVNAAPSSDAPFDRRELLAASEPLPWKERRVGIDYGFPQNHANYAARPQTPANRYLPSALDALKDSSEKKSREEELNDWWTRDNRIDIRARQEINNYMAEAQKRRQMQKQADRAALHAANFSDERSIAAPRPEEKEEDNSDFAALLLPVLANLRAYKTGPRDHFNRFASPPSWAIDHTPQGNESFFSQDWGVPPARVGRDPRYRAVQHDGRSSVFEDPTGKWPREEYNRHGWW